MSKSHLIAISTLVLLTAGGAFLAAWIIWPHVASKRAQSAIHSLLAKGYSSTKANDHDLAESNLLEAVELADQHSLRAPLKEGLVLLGRLYLAMENYPKARKTYERLYALTPELSEEWRDRLYRDFLLNVCLHTGEFDMAIQLVTGGRREEYRPSVNVWEYCEDLARVMSARGDWEQAAKLYRESIEGLVAIGGPQHHLLRFTYSELGEIYRRLGRLDEARECHDLAFEIIGMPPWQGHPGVESFLHLRAGLLDDEDGNYASAQIHYDKSLAMLRAMESLRSPADFGILLKMREGTIEFWLIRDAEKLLQESARIRKKNSKDDVQVQASAKSNLDRLKAVEEFLSNDTTGEAL